MVMVECMEVLLAPWLRGLLLLVLGLWLGKTRTFSLENLLILISQLPHVTWVFLLPRSTFAFHWDGLMDVWFTIYNSHCHHFIRNDLLDKDQRIILGLNMSYMHFPVLHCFLIYKTCECNVISFPSECTLNLWKAASRFFLVLW